MKNMEARSMVFTMIMLIIIGGILHTLQYTLLSVVDSYSLSSVVASVFGGGIILSPLLFWEHNSNAGKTYIKAGPLDLQSVLITLGVLLLVSLLLVPTRAWWEYDLGSVLFTLTAGGILIVFHAFQSKPGKEVSAHSS